jgi:hypothetical protein
LVLYFLLFLLGGVRHIVSSGARVGCVVDLRGGRRTMHFAVGDELLPHTIVKIPSGEKMHVGVVFFSSLSLFIFYSSVSIYILYVVFQLL